MGAHLHQQGPTGQLLVIAGGPEGHGPGQGRVEGIHALLELAGQGEVFHPVGVAAVLAPAHHHHHLGGIHPVDAGHRLVHRAVLSHQGVPVDVQHDLNGGVLFQIIGYRGGGAGVGLVVLGVVVEGAVVEHAQPHLGEHPFHLVSHPEHVVSLVQGAGGVAGGVHVGTVLGVGLGGVGMDDQDLGALGGQGDGHRSGGGRSQVHALPGAVVQVEPTGHVIPLGAGGGQGAGHHIGGSRGDLAVLRHVVVVLGGLSGGELELLLLVLIEKARHRLLAAGEEQRLAHRQPVPPVQPRQGGIFSAGLAQLGGQGGPHKALILSQALQGPRRPAPAQQQPGRQGGQKQGSAPPQQPVPLDRSFVHTSTILICTGPRPSLQPMRRGGQVCPVRPAAKFLRHLDTVP